MILRWPAGVDKGIVSSESTIFLDVAPTVLSAAGIQRDQPMDGLNLLDDINRF
jgi:arylsulfatase A-like enzyme